MTDGFSHDGVVLSLKGEFAEQMVAWCAELVATLPAFLFHPRVRQLFQAGGSGESITHLYRRADCTLDTEESKTIQ